MAVSLDMERLGQLPGRGLGPMAISAATFIGMAMRLDITVRKLKHPATVFALRLTKAPGIPLSSACGSAMACALVCARPIDA